MKKIVALSILSCSLLVASGYRLPVSSLKSVALSGAYVANTSGADTAYYNPANMVFDIDANQIEGALTNVGLPSVKYTDNRNPAFSSKSENENILVPTFFYSSKDYSGVRYGFSLIVPAGLTKRWESSLAKAYAQEFALKIIELNPSAAYKVNDKFAVGGGLRVVYSKGVIKSDGSDVGKTIKREMEANALELGYNVALTYRPISALNIAATYRSNVDIHEEGNAKLYLGGDLYYDGGASLKVTLPAIAALAISYDFGNTVIEFEYDRTFWSEYKNLDFEFVSEIPLDILKDAFDDPKPRYWKDSDAFRFGLTHKLNEKITLLAGYAIDKTPVQEKYLGFETPDSDSMLYTGGVYYKYSDKISFGGAISYTDKDDRSVKNETIDGEFTDSSALLTTLGVSYKF
jgi:long-chain fatty acid transport protein